MNAEATCNRDSSCGSLASRSAVATTGTVAVLEGLISTALCAAMQTEQCEDGAACPARTTCT